MADEPIQAKPTKTSFVYDTRTGKVVHIHQFVPCHPDGTCSNSEMEKAALELAPARCDRAHLAVLHHDGDKYDPSIRYRVDCDNYTLVAENAGHDPATLHALQK